MPCMFDTSYLQHICEHRANLSEIYRMVSYLLVTFIAKGIYIHYIYIYIIYIYISPIPIFSFCDYPMYLIDDWFGDKRNVPRGMSLQANFKLLIEPH